MSPPSGRMRSVTDSAILHDALNSVKGTTVTASAPEWSGRTRALTISRLILAVLLLLFGGIFLWQAMDETPGEANLAEELFVARAEEASTTAGVALENRRAARAELVDSRRRLVAARTAQRPTSAGRVRALIGEVASDKAALERARRNHRVSRQQRAAALDDILAAPDEPSDVDLARVVGLTAIPLIAVVGSVALLAPRRSQPLSLTGVPPAAPVGSSSAPVRPEAPGPSGRVTGSTAPDLPAVKGPSSSAAPSSFVQREPAIAQGMVAAAVLIGGVFGIQQTEGTREILLNIAIPLVPILGAFFTRRNVAARPNISEDEKARLFG